MLKEGANTGNAGKGRPKGSPNKTTTTVKEALCEAFEKAGGVPSLVEFARNNPKEFYGIWGRLAPRELVGANGGPLTLTVTFQREAKKTTANG